MQCSLHLALCSEKQDGMSERGRQGWQEERPTDPLLKCPKCLLLDTVYPPGFKKIGQTKSRI